MNEKPDSRILAFDGVSLTYHTKEGETLAVKDLSFTVREGEFMAVIGPSGCGKTTVLSLAAGLLAPSSGTIAVRGKSASENAGKFGYMLQKDHLFEWRTVYSNVVLGLEIQKKMTPDRLQKVDAMLDTYGLSDFRNARPSQLSGGMRQRAALIRTLALEPDLLLLDEPTSNVDSINEGIILRALKENCKDKAVILVSHRESTIAGADRVYRIEKGVAHERKQ